MKPIFNPGDQKVFRSRGEPRPPRLAALAYLVLALGGAGLGVVLLVAGQLAGGLVLLGIGLGAAALILKGEISERLMERRMRERTNKK